VLSRLESYRISTVFRGTAHRPPCTGTDAADLAASVIESAAFVIRVCSRQDSRLPEPASTTERVESDVQEINIRSGETSDNDVARWDYYSVPTRCIYYDVYITLNSHIICHIGIFIVHGV